MYNILYSIAYCEFSHTCFVCDNTWHNLVSCYLFYLSWTQSGAAYRRVFLPWISISTILFIVRYKTVLQNKVSLPWMFTSHVYHTLFPFAQLVKKFFAFLMKSGRFITVLTRACCHWILGQINTAISPHVISVGSVIILRSNVQLHLPYVSGLFCLGFPTEMLYAYCSSLFHGSVVSLSLIWSLMHEDLQCAFPRSSCYTLFLNVQIFSLIVCSEIPCIYVSFSPCIERHRFNTRTKP
jgi:hypothetical protein